MTDARCYECQNVVMDDDRTKKHLLIVKSTVDSQKATEKKSEISNALQGLHIVDTKFKQRNGNVISNFETQEQSCSEGR